MEEGPLRCIWHNVLSSFWPMLFPSFFPNRYGNEIVSRPKNLKKSENKCLCDFYYYLLINVLWGFKWICQKDPSQKSKCFSEASIVFNIYKIVSLTTRFSVAFLAISLFGFPKQLPRISNVRGSDNTHSTNVCQQGPIGKVSSLSRHSFVFFSATLYNTNRKSLTQ